jgi:hypothetical protein
MHLGYRSNFWPGVTGAAKRVAADPMIGVTRDTASGKYVPLTQVEWNTVFSVAGVSAKTLAHSWGFQDASGNAVATTGTNLTAAGTITYQQAVAGWTRTAQRFAADVLAGQRFAAGTGPNPATQSTLWMCYTQLSTPSAGRIFMGTNGAVNDVLLISAVPRLQLTVNAVNTTGVNNLTGVVRPFAIQHDRTNSVDAAYSDQEKLVGTFAASVNDGTKGFGPGAAAPPMDILAGWTWQAANAEWTPAELKAVWQTLNWTIPWT